MDELGLFRVTFFWEHPIKSIEDVKEQSSKFGNAVQNYLANTKIPTLVSVYNEIKRNSDYGHSVFLMVKGNPDDLYDSVVEPLVSHLRDKGYSVHGNGYQHLEILNPIQAEKSITV